MVRGCQKKIIYLKNTGSEVFDEAYFVVNDKKISENNRECDMVEEANKILNECISITEQKGTLTALKKKIKEKAPIFFIGLFVGIILTLLIK